MKSTLTSLFILVTLCINAQFSGYYDPANWGTSHSAACDNGYIDATGAPGSLLIVGSEAEGCGSSWVSYDILVETCGEITFDWTYTTDDVDGSSFDPFGYFINGVGTQLSGNGYPDGTTHSGSATVAVNAGDVFSLYMYSTDNILGRAWTSVSNFSGPDATCDLTLTVDPASIYLGYGSNCVTLNVTATSSNGAVTVTGTEVCATEAGCLEATVTATDEACCEVSVTVQVQVVDATCHDENGKPKVQICHNGHTICVSPNAVAAHLAHGDVLGDCGEAPDCGGQEGLQNEQEIVGRSSEHNGTAQGVNSMFANTLDQLKAMSADQTESSITINPNPATDIAIVNVNRGMEGPVTVTVYSLNGQVVLSSQADVTRGVPVQVNVSKLNEGSYIIGLESRNGNRMSEKLTISNK